MVVAILVVLAIIFIFTRIMDGDRWEWSSVTLFSFWAFLVIGIVYLLTYSWSVSTNADLVAFAAENREAYQTTAQLTRKMVTGDSSADKSSSLVVDGSAWEQAKVASERLKEYRDAVLDYNTTLRTKRAYVANGFLRQWIAPPPDELKYIQFTSP